MRWKTGFEPMYKALFVSIILMVFSASVARCDDIRQNIVFCSDGKHGLEYGKALQLTIDRLGLSWIYSIDTNPEIIRSADRILIFAVYGSQFQELDCSDAIASYFGGEIRLRFHDVQDIFSLPPYPGTVGPAKAVYRPMLVEDIPVLIAIGATEANLPTWLLLHYLTDGGLDCEAHNTLCVEIEQIFLAVAKE